MEYYIPVKNVRYGRIKVEAETPKEALKTYKEEGGDFDDSYEEQLFPQDEWDVDEKEVMIDENDKEYNIEKIGEEEDDYCDNPACLTHGCQGDCR